MKLNIFTVYLEFRLFLSCWRMRKARVCGSKLRLTRKKREEKRGQTQQSSSNLCLPPLQTSSYPFENPKQHSQHIGRLSFLIFLEHWIYLLLMLWLILIVCRSDTHKTILSRGEERWKWIECSILPRLIRRFWRALWLERKSQKEEEKKEDGNWPSPKKLKSSPARSPPLVSTQ